MIFFSTLGFYHVAILIALNQNYVWGFFKEAQAFWHVRIAVQITEFQFQAWNHFMVSEKFCKTSNWEIHHSANKWKTNSLSSSLRNARKVLVPKWLLFGAKIVK